MLRRAMTAVLLGLLCPLGTALAQSAASTAAGAGATVDDGISIAKSADLSFGTVVPSSVTGTVTVSTADLRTAAGGATLHTGSAGAAVFTVTKLGPGSKKFAVLLPASATLISSTDSSQTMTLEGFTHNAAVSNPYSAAPFTLRVGGTLHVSANQAAGSYSGTFDVTVVQQ